MKRQIKLRPIYGTDQSSNPAPQSESFVEEVIETELLREYRIPPADRLWSQSMRRL